MISAGVSPEALRARLGSTSEWVLVDVREEGRFSEAHLLSAASIPLSRMELLIGDLVPHQSTPVVLCGGAELTARAASRLRDLGYRDLAVFPGSPDDWRAAGFEIYSGIHVPSKAFGEFIEARCATPHIDSTELKARLDAGEHVLICDSRPLDEYATRSIPNAINVPGAELVYSINDLVSSPDTLVVVNCGGRTRSIIGAQSLINAGVRNRVVALKNGTMGWHLAGLALEQGQARRPPPVSQASLEWSKAAATRLAKRFNVSSIGRSTLGKWAEESDRTLYIFDVRQPDEYVAGHLSGSRSVQGGQLVQETDRFIAVKNSRVVLVDDTGVRATVVASWLLQMGLSETYVLADGLGDALETGPCHGRVLGGNESPAEEIPAARLLAMAEHERPTFIDFSLSSSYRRGHIPGSYFAIRAQLAESLAEIGKRGAFVVTCEDGRLARLAAQDVARLSGVPTKALAGGNAAWLRAGGKLEADNALWAVPPVDVWLKPFDQLQGRVEDRLNRYLTWETDLMEQVSRDGSLRFNLESAGDRGH